MEKIKQKYLDALLQKDILAMDMRLKYESELNRLNKENRLLRNKIASAMRLLGHNL